MLTNNTEFWGTVELQTEFQGRRVRVLGTQYYNSIALPLKWISWALVTAALAGKEAALGVVVGRSVVQAPMFQQQFACLQDAL